MFRPLFVLSAVLILAFTSSCSRLGLSGGSNHNLALTLQIENTSLQPGAPLFAQVELKNADSGSVLVKNLDHMSVYFAYWPKGEEGKSESTRFVEPVFSEQERLGTEVDLQPGQSVKRTFVFPNLTLRRGSFLLQATYVRSSRSQQQKTFSPSVEYTVSGEKVVAYRYGDGVLSKTNAIAIAAAEAGMPDAAGDAVMVLDEKGFRKWWVNLYPAAPAAPLGAASQPAGQAFDSYFVDPFLARVWRRAEPWGPEMRNRGIKELSKDSKAVQALKDKRRQ